MYMRAQAVTSVTGGAACTVCSHPRVAEIDADLLVPTNGYAKLSRVWGVHREALSRHKRSGHVVPQRALAPRQPQTLAPLGSGEDEDPKTAVEVLEEILRDLRKTDTSGFTPREKNTYTEQVRRTAESLAKYQQAVDREGPAQKELRALEEMHNLALDELERFPEARRAVAGAVAAWKARRGQEEG